MHLNDDKRGFILSGIALLLVLPAMLLAASYLGMISIGGETTSLEVLSDKVNYAGHDIERVIDYMKNNEIPRDNQNLNTLAENYRVATGLIVEIVQTQQGISVKVRDPMGAAQYSSIVEP